MESLRFKFRVFNKGAFTYFDFDLLNDESRAFYTNEIKDNNVMQYTGLKDKNGVEIYEGDIINHKYSEFRGSSWTKKTWIGVLEWCENDTLYILKNKKQNKIHFHSVSEDCIEVIGNIYENKDLLKKG